jgi:hypothetical protein
MWRYAQENGSANLCCDSKHGKSLASTENVLLYATGHGVLARLQWGASRGLLVVLVHPVKWLSDLRPLSARRLLSCLCGTPSLTRSRVCRVSFSASSDLSVLASSIYVTCVLRFSDSYKITMQSQQVKIWFWRKLRADLVLVMFPTIQSRAFCPPLCCQKI